MLRATLDLHPEIIMHGEVMGPNAVRGVNRKCLSEYRFCSKTGFQSKMFALRKKNTIGFIDQVLFRVPPDKKAVGFKLLVDHALSLEFADASQWLAAGPDIKIIWLERRNHLARYSSTLLAKRGRVLLPYTSVTSDGASAANNDQPTSGGEKNSVRSRSWLSYLGGQFLPAGKQFDVPGCVNVDVDEFMQETRNLTAAWSRLRDLYAHCDSMVVCYEDLVLEPEQNLSAIYDFLGVSLDGPLEFVTKKINPADLYASILNLHLISHHPEISRYL